MRSAIVSMFVTCSMLFTVTESQAQQYQYPPQYQQPPQQLPYPKVVQQVPSFSVQYSVVPPTPIRIQPPDIVVPGQQVIVGQPNIRVADPQVLYETTSSQVVQRQPVQQVQTIQRVVTVRRTVTVATPVYAVPVTTVLVVRPRLLPRLRLFGLGYTSY